MRRGSGPSRAERRRNAERLLQALLRSPKTRAGLIAAAKSEGVTENFVYGYLSQTTRAGDVTMLKSAVPVQYQLTQFIVIERPAEGSYPEWLEPRVLPDAIGRRVYFDGKAVGGAHP